MKQKRREQISHGSPIPLNKLVQIMKLATFFIFVGCLHLSATAWSQTGNSTLSISLKKVPLEEALATIAQKAVIICFTTMKSLHKPIVTSVLECEEVRLRR